MHNTYIWWLDKWALMMVDSLDEMAYQGHPDYPPLPGHLKMTLRGLANTQQFTGEILTPVTFDRNDLLNQMTEHWERVDLLKQHEGIAFEAAHLDIVSKYPGIITDVNFQLVTTRGNHPKF